MKQCEKCERGIGSTIGGDQFKTLCEYCEHPQIPNSIIASIRRRAFREAACVVADHWNDQSHITNQRQQAQRSANSLLDIAKKQEEI